MNDPDVKPFLYKSSCRRTDQRPRRIDLTSPEPLRHLLRAKIISIDMSDVLLPSPKAPKSA